MDQRGFGGGFTRFFFSLASPLNKNKKVTIRYLALGTLFQRLWGSKPVVNIEEVGHYILTVP